MRKLLFGFTALFVLTAAAQSTADEETINFRGSVTATSKGISTFPNLTLGKPALIFDLGVHGKRFSFEPVFRFSMLDAKPWTFLFWGRYRLFTGEKFTMSVGAHPALSFKTITTTEPDGSTKDVIRTQRALAVEITPTYHFNRNVSLMLHYLYSLGLERADQVRNANFVALRASFNNIRLSDKYSMRVSPQLYFLQLDNTSGTYANLSVAVARRDFPVSISSMYNQRIRSTIAGEEMLWNVSLVYSFGGRYSRAR